MDISLTWYFVFLDQKDNLSKKQHDLKLLRNIRFCGIFASYSELQNYVDNVFFQNNFYDKFALVIIRYQQY